MPGDPVNSGACNTCILEQILGHLAEDEICWWLMEKMSPSLFEMGDVNLCRVFPTHRHIGTGLALSGHYIFENGKPR